MEERSQGATEYLMMLSAILAVVVGIIFLLFGTSTGLGSSVEGRIENTRDMVVNILT